MRSSTVSNSSSTFLSSAHETEVHEQIAFKSFHQHEKRVIFYIELDTTLKKGKTVPSVNLEKLKVSSRKSCLYRMIKLKTPLRSFRSQSKHLHGWLPKVAELFINTFSEQDFANSPDNDVLIFDSLSAILKMETREEQPKSTAHEQRFSVY